MAPAGIAAEVEGQTSQADIAVEGQFEVAGTFDISGEHDHFPVENTAAAQEKRTGEEHNVVAPEKRSEEEHIAAAV